MVLAGLGAMTSSCLYLLLLLFCHTTDASNTTIECEPLIVANGKTSTNVTISGTTVVFSCREGYRLLGDANVTCQENGNWSHSPPTCEVSFCERLFNPTNGTKSTNESTPGTAVRFRCDIGFVLLGAANLTCRQNGTWSGPKPLCQALYCEPLPTPINGTKSTEATAYETVVEFTCGEGYVLVGSSRLSCLSDGRWSSCPPSCEAVQCYAISAPSNGIRWTQSNGREDIEGSGISNGSVSGEIVESGSGFRNSSSECYTDSTDARNGSSVGETIFFDCKDGYLLRGPRSIVCLPSGNWSDSQPLCLPIYCRRVMVPRNGSVTTNSTEIGTVVEFSCDPGYSLVGSHDLKCESSGNWSDTEPECHLSNEDPTLPELSTERRTYTDAPTSSFGATDVSSSLGEDRQTYEPTSSFEATDDSSSSGEDRPTNEPTASFGATDDYSSSSGQEKELDFCESAPCRNGGICTNFVSGYACDCISGYTGQNCGADMDECLTPNQCLNGGACTNVPGSFNCTCVGIFAGNRCEVEDPNLYPFGPSQGDNQLADFDDGASPPISLPTCFPFGRARHRLSYVSSNGLVSFDQAFVDWSPIVFPGSGFLPSIVAPFWADVDISNGNGNIFYQVYNSSSQILQRARDDVRTFTNATFNATWGLVVTWDRVPNFPAGHSSLRNTFQVVIVSDERMTYALFNYPIGDLLQWIGNPAAVVGYMAIDLSTFENHPLSGTDSVLSVASSSNVGVPGRYLYRVSLPENECTDECSSLPCENNGTCVNGFSTFSCTCSFGFFGSVCQSEVNECLSMPCANGGTCEDQRGDFFCSCPPGLTGKTCREETDECSTDPCFNGGTCTDLFLDFTCDCGLGYTGRTCNIDINECEGSPCLNSGSCEDLIGEFTCSCLAGFTGVYCETDINKCSSMLCQNGACKDPVNEFTCDCFAGYTGAFCETEINECDPNPCQNGGTCFDSIGSFTCYCPPEFGGSRCHLGCLSRVENCTEFVKCANRVFPCEAPNYLHTFLSPACPARGSESFTTWFTDVLICLANLASNTIADVYGVNRMVTPFAEECRLVDHRLFNGLRDCVRSDNLCHVRFTRDDALFLRDVLEKSPTYRDVNFDIMLDVVRSCPAPSPGVAELRSALEAKGFVLCGRIDPAHNLGSPSAIINILTSLLEELISGAGSSLRLSNGALLECEDRQRNGGNRFSHSVNKTSGVFGVISNGTKATSPTDICRALDDSSGSGSGSGSGGGGGSGGGRDAIVDCPVCGDGILRLDSEECDDGGNDDGDGCSAACVLEDGFGCRVTAGRRTICLNQTCGDGVRVPGEDCDTGSSGVGCDSFSCTILDGFECPDNEEFNGPSLCFNCGNGIRELFEECDTLNGTGKNGDGCNDTCGVVDFFTCTGALGRESECEHVAVDFNVADITTLNRTVVSREPNSTVLLAPKQENLDASEFGNEDWKEIIVELTNPVHPLKERATFAPDDAVLWEKLGPKEKENLIDIRTLQYTTESGGKGIRVLRGVNPNNLTHVLLGIGYFNSETDPDFHPRLLLVTIIDSNGFPTPVIGVTVQFVGKNDDKPVLTIGTAATRYKEGSRTPIDVTSNSLILMDPDHHIHLMQSATARILSSGSGTLTIRDHNDVVKSEVGVAGKEISLSGNASTVIYQALLNNVTYKNWEPEFEGMDDVNIEFRVFDGKFNATAIVLVRLINFNVPPLECSSMPCQNGGLCRDGFNGYACECELGYTGAICETLILCPTLPADESLTISTADRTIRTFARFSCIPGFILNGMSVLYCNEDGEWSNSIPYCDRIHCRPLEEIENGALSSNATAFGTVVRFSCDNEYHLFGASSLACAANGRWSGVEPECRLPNGALRLVDGLTEYEGRVEIYFNGHWGTVCDDSLSIVEANIVCRQLFNTTAIAHRSRAFFGQGVGRIWLDDIRCLGSETQLDQCFHSGFGVHNCGHFEDAGVSCFSSRPDVRLVGGADSDEGRVEVNVNGVWGTVCDDFWDLNDAHVVCRQLGLGSAVGSLCCARFGRGSGQIWLDSVGCTGTEERLDQCRSNGWGIHDCSHREDAGIVCQGTKCPDLGSIENGARSTISRSFGTVVAYSCNEGYRLIGEQTLTCRTDRTWSERLPVCEDINECEDSPCQNGGTCSNLSGSFSCLCTAFYVGSVCDEEAGSLYPYGFSQGDSNMPHVDDSASEPIRLPNCFPFGSRKHRTAYISTNGLVSFDHPYTNYVPRVFPGNTFASIIAPFWGDVDIRRDGDIFYHAYDDPLSPFIERARMELTEFLGTEFRPTWILVVTWDRVPNYPDGSFFLENRETIRRNTFQVVIATDEFHSYALFNYPPGGLQWSGRYFPRGVVGYMTDDSRLVHNHYLAGSEFILALADVQQVSNVARRGRYLARLSSSSRSPCIAETLCVQWYNNDIVREGIFPSWTRFSVPCPCTFTQARLSGLYGFHSLTSKSVCFAARFSGWQGEQTKCCYSRPPSGGAAHRYHPWTNGLEHWRSDLLPHQYCCVDSNLCHLYYARRPSIDCSRFVPPWFTTGRGDPHVATLDGRDYTFNGLGEYMIFKSTDESFVFQGRTQLVNGSTATVFSAFVAGAFEPSDSYVSSSLDSTVVYVELAGNSSVRVWVCCYEAANSSLTDSLPSFGELWREITSDVLDLIVNEESLPLRNAVLSRKENGTVELLFTSGITVEVQPQNGLLTFIFSAPEQFKGATSGLIGRWDDNVANDLVSRSGVEISINSTDREIHNQFGQTWQVSQEESLFYYKTGENVSTFSFPDHIPVFADELLEQATPEQRAICDNDPSCLFDLLETNDPSIALGTLETAQTVAAATASMNNRPPEMTGSGTFRATLGVASFYNFSVFDNDSYSVRVEGSNPPLGDYSLNEIEEGLFLLTWTPSSIGSVNFVFVANDSNGAESQLEPLTRLCACALSKGATCEESESDGGEAKFVLEDCNCGVGWEGQFCDIDEDGCVDAGCPDGTNCTDVPAPGVGANCSDCPLGTELIEGKCEDINECESNSSLSNCTQICVDDTPFFHCECHGGFQLDSDGRTCTDIDECTQSSPCHQICINTDGSFECLCNPGFILESNNVTCRPSLNCTAGNLCAHICVKNATTGNEDCACWQGYTLDSNNQTCSDVDECSLATENCQQLCTNIMGGYRCDCRSGFNLVGDSTCEDANECLNSSTCRFGGELCVNFPGGFNCSCPFGTEVINETCTAIDDCESAPCLNGAECRDGNGEFYCVCPSGFFGDRCESEIDECASNPCVNNGTCHDGRGDFSCDCIPGYEGKTCGDEINECERDPCLNGGVCADKFLAFVCNCSDGFEGERCETNINECVSEPCHNNGSCIDGIASYRCVCLERFTGSLCEGEIHCPWLPSPANGTKSTNETAFGTVLHFSCDGELSVVGSLSIVCESCGNWSGSVPVCRHVTNISVVPRDVFSSSLLATATASVIAVTADDLALFSQGQFDVTLEAIPLTVPAKTSLLIVVKATDYSTMTATFVAYSSEGYSLSVRLRQRQYLTRLTYNASTRFTVSLVNANEPAAWVDFEDNSLNVSSGAEIEFSLRAINPFESLLLAPQLFALNSVAQRVYLDSYALLEIDIRETAENATVGLNRPAQLRLRIDERAKLNEGDRISAWFHSDSRAIWNENGDGLVSLVNEQLVWTATIDRLGWWNCDRFWTERACVSAAVLHLRNDIEEPLPGAVVVLEGDLFNYRVTASTSPDGRSCLETLVGQASSVRVSHEALGYDSRDAVELPGLNESSHCGGEQTIEWRTSVSSINGNCEELSFLFVDCGQLMQPDFGTLSLPSTVSVFGSHLTLLAIAHFECATGFVLSGEAELTCWRNGTWSDFSPQCLGRCPVLDDPLFGSKSTSNRLSGTVVQFDCDENYVISGPSNITCRANGTWSADEPTCEELRCPPLAIENGRSSTNETERGTIVEIVCDEGHSLDLGPRQFSCLSNGSWSATIPICSIVHCPALGAPVNGAKESNQTVFQSVVEFECNFGYYIQGASNVTCLASGGWSAAEPICQPVRCDQLDVLLNGRNSTSETIFGTRVEFNCDVGFELNGLREIVCFPNGSWSGIVPWCKAIHCGNLTVPSNGFLSSEKTIFDTTVKFDCENGYMLIGESHLTCLLNGTWSNLEPLCRIVYCPELSSPGNGTILSNSTKFGTEVCFNCSTGFQLIGDSCVACTANATWSGNEPHCIVIGCPNLLPLANGRILSVESSVEGLDVVKFDCNDGYELNGLWNITCLSSGNWSGDQPECQDIDECECMPCRNGGSCTDGINAFSCECLPGYRGENCETELNECESMPCLNGGNCADLVADYSCACLSGYTGSDCETDIDECASWPCENNGTCIDGIDGSSCDCVIGFTGNTCETNVNECASNPCQNNGTCLDKIDGFICTCVSEYTGDVCETNIVECESEPCHNGGTCVDSIDGYTCTCKSGYTGVVCETDINECEFVSCRNGGTCVDDVARYTCQCVLGYTGVDCETDIDECEAKTCRNGGTCVDGLNEHTCKCIPGYTGDSCETDIDECASAPCQNGGNCTNEINQFTCNCLNGYLGNVCETNVDECASMPCENGGTCIDAVNEYTCQCVAGYTGNLCEADINECLIPSHCLNGGTCRNALGSFFCACAEFFTGDYCEIADPNLYPFGHGQHDSRLPSSDDGLSPSISLPTCFPFGRARHRSAYVSNNGLISFDAQFNSVFPERFPVSGFPSIVAPFWADVDTRRDGSVFHHVYTNSSSPVLQRANVDVSRFTKTTFNAAWCLVATWDRVPNFPHGRSDFAPDTLSAPRNTFQVVIVTDERSTYVLFNYPIDGRLQWIGRLGQNPAAVGYMANDLSAFQNHPLSGTTSVLSVASSSNVGVVGRYVYRVSSAGNRCESRGACLDWYHQDISLDGAFPVWHLFVQPCPCTLLQAATDFRFMRVVLAEDQALDRSCFVSVFGGINGQQSECCYRSTFFSSFVPFFSSGTFDDGSLITQRPFAGSANRFHSLFNAFNHDLSDVQPYRRCCFESDLCNLYFERRPPPRGCSQRFRVFFVWTWGDPHFTTLDGNEYTFNGLGEYLIFKSADNRFEFQGRTQLVANSTATEFSAFVGRQFSNESDSSTTVHVGLISATELRIMVCCYAPDAPQTEALSEFNGSSWRDVSTNFSKLSPNGVLLLDDVVLSRGEANGSLVMSFSSEITVSITARSGLLSYVLGLSDEFQGKTRGLSGRWDGDPANDFVPRVGEQISVDAPSRTIHNDFGQTWQITASESLFYYRVGESVLTFSDPNHEPIFIDEISLDSYTDEQRQKCNDDPPCLFDLEQTGSDEVALTTLLGRAGVAEASEIQSNNPPELFGNDTFRAKIFVESVYRFTATDVGDNFTVVIERSPAIGEKDFTLERDGSQFALRWTPRRVGSVSFTVIANDSRGAVSELQPLVRLCGCALQNGAECIEVDTDGGEDGFILEDCECGPGWTGDLCDIDQNGCIDPGCPIGTNCTDIPAPGTGAICSDCPIGSELDGAKCSDIDECEANLDNCSQICINEVPFFRCDCKSGFRPKNQTQCIDINECEEMKPCHQVCSNTIGSFDCACFEGFKLDTDNVTCIPTENCTSSNYCGQICARNVTSGNETCSCFRGFRLDFSEKNCSDIDECAEGLANCDHNCSNVDGSFQCSCREGFRLAENSYSCLDINECVEGGVNASVCLIFGQLCTNIDGGFNCDCPSLTEVINGTCAVIDDCASNPCRNGAICIDGFGSFMCECPTGFSGPLCENEEDECQSMPCTNGGLCEDRRGDFFCSCPRGYTGKTCSDETDECSPNPCLNSGNCTDLFLNFTCNCTQGYTGRECEIDINECESNPCTNGGVCHDLEAEFGCTCPEGFTGSYCETDVDECLSMPCQNGTCTDLVNDFTCLCLSGYTGKFCEMEINECNPNPCQNGGTCFDEIGSFTCECPPEFRGQQCQIGEARCSSRIQNCTDFVKCAKRFFSCDSPSFLDTFLYPVCQARGTYTFNFWLGQVSICLSNLTSTTIAEVYGINRTVAPFAEECRLVDHRLFNGLDTCLQRYDLCTVQFSRSDALTFRETLRKFSAYRDSNFNTVLDIVRSCPNETTVRQLRSVLEAEGFVICGSIDTEQRPQSSFIDVLATFFESLISGTGNSLHLNSDALLECESRRGNRLRRAVNESSGAFGVITNGTNATSPIDICQLLDNSQPETPNVTVDCPVCGDGVLQIDSEECDDSNTVPGDGCSDTCELEEGFGCRTPVGERTVCYNKTCGDGIRVPGEDCDSGSDGYGCESFSCTILDGFECPVNAEFDGSSECFNCGNGIREFFEECDTLNGTGKDIDGCNDTCNIVELFTCTGNRGAESDCKHVAVDFNVADQTTLNGTVLYREANTIVLLAPKRENLDASAFGNEDWKEVVVELTNPLDSLEERVIFSTSTAVSVKRLTPEERSQIIGISTIQFVTESGSEGIRVVRGASPANLTHVLLSLGYFSSIRSPDFNPRFLQITVIDSNTYSTPVVGLTVQFVGENDNAPVLTIETSVTHYEEGSQTPIGITSNSLNLTDPDHPFHLLNSSTVKIRSGGSGSLAIINNEKTVQSEVKHFGKEIVLTGNATADVFQALLNNVTYTNFEPEFESLDDVYIEFSVFDGKFKTVKQVLVRLIDFNVAPVVRFLHAEVGTISYTEGHSPSFLSVGVNITDVNDVAMAGATVLLVDGHSGDALVLNNSTAADVGVSVQSQDNYQSITLSGSASITNYEMILSSLGFINNLSPPVNLSSDPRMATVIVDDGQNRSVPAAVRIVVIPASDGPILRFTPLSQPLQLASLADRSHSITFTENGSPVKVLSNDTVLIDVDSFYAGNATLSFNTTRTGDIVSVNVSIASSHGVTVIGQGTSSAYLSGIASFAAYLEILLSVTYSNTASEPEKIVPQIVVRVWDMEGVASLPVFVSVSTAFINDGPQLNLGVGLGKDDRIQFVENQKIEQHIVSRAHDVLISDSVEGNNITSMTVELTANYPGRLDAVEYVYLRKSTACPGLMYQPDSSGKLLTFTGMDDGKLYSCTVGRLFYFSSADEPTVFVSDSSLEKIGRKILVTVFDNGIPPASSSAASYVDIVTINDNPPRIATHNETECITETTNNRGNRRRRDIKGEEAETDEREPFVQKRKRVYVTLIEVEGASNDRVNPGTAVILKFSHETNMPSVHRPSDLSSIIRFSPNHLNNVPVFGLWDNSRTLAIVFPKGAYQWNSSDFCGTKDVKLTFVGKDRANSCQSCDYGICHFSGIPCRVTGTYTIEYEKPASSSSGLVVDQETIVVNWAVVALAILCIFITAAAVTVMGWRYKRGL